MKDIEAIVIIHLFVVIALSLAQVTVSWDVNKTKEFKNGDTMELICTVTGSTCCLELRRWNGGSLFSSLMNNGTPSNDAKYHEVINSNSFSLFIHNMVRSDFLYNYSCSYGFDESTRSLLSPPDNARYVPIESEIDVLSSSTGGGLLNFVVNVTTVFPAPSCTATFKNTNLTSNMTLTSTDNFPFKFAVLSMTNVSYTCPGPLIVSCSVGSYSFNVLTIVDFCLISATPSSETTSEMESSKLKVAVTVDISKVLSSFESTDFTFILDTSLNTNTLSLEDSISRILPLSTIGSFEPTLKIQNEYTTHVNEVNSSVFSLQTSNYIDETIKTGFLNSDMSTSTKNSLPISFASIVDITTGTSFQNDLTQILHIPTSEIIQNTQTRYSSLFNSVLLHTQTSNIQTDSSPRTSAKFNTNYIESLSLQSSLNSFIMSSVSKNTSADTFLINIEHFPESTALAVETSFNNHMFTSGDPWSVSQTGNVFVNTSNVDSFIIKQTVHSTDLSVRKIVPSAVSSSSNSFISLADTLTLQYNDIFANESISSKVYQSLQLSSFDKPVAFLSEIFNGNSQFRNVSSTSSSNPPVRTVTPSVNHFTFSELTTTLPVINSTLTEATNLNGISSLLIKFSTATRSTTIHNVSILSPSSSLKLETFKEFSSVFEILSTYMNNDVISNINSIQSSYTFYMLSSQPTFRPSHTPGLSFREAQHIILPCSIAVVVLVVCVSLMVMYYLRKVQRAKKLKENSDKSENTDLSISRYLRVFHYDRTIVNDHPNIGKHLPVRFHNRSLSDAPYACNYEHHWNSVTC